MKGWTILHIIANIALGFILFWGGIQKFTNPTPAPTAQIEQLQEEGVEAFTENTAELQIRNYIFGMKQTGYFWPVLGFAELLGGLLLLIQATSLLGAVISLPAVLHIFLFHLFLESEEIGELIQTAVMLGINLAIIIGYYPRWKHLVWIPLKWKKA